MAPLIFELPQFGMEPLNNVVNKFLQEKSLDSRTDEFHTKNGGKL